MIGKVKSMLKKTGLILLLLLMAPYFSVMAVPPYSGGETTRVIPREQSSSRSAFSFPATNLSLSRQDSFFVGNSFFRNAWITAPATTRARDGLGPLYNTNSCQTCHIRDGRGAPPANGKPMTSMLVRVSVLNDEPENILYKKLGVKPHPTYGGQIQNHAIPGVSHEAKVTVQWKIINKKFNNGKTYQLRRPQIVFNAPGYGALDDSLLVSPRVAPQLIGVGLLDLIPDATLAKLADPEDKDNDGISGRLNQVWDVRQRSFKSGRFGWKAEQPNVLQQVAAAFNGDIGITSSLFPEESCTVNQEKCQAAPTGGKPEVSDEILEFVTFYTSTLAVPARRSHDDDFIKRGEGLFQQANCNSCHVEQFKTEISETFPELGGQEIHPYTDLLLHDMGEGLADQRPSFSASGREWRTPPLWGIGLIKLVNQHTNFLHDGRARNFEEAILWHGGEAEKSRDAYLSYTKEQQRQLLAFLKSL